jgi:predicted PurR-regulated permease PerM
MPAFRIPVAYRAVLLAAMLVVLGLLFQQLATLILGVLLTVIIAIPLSAGATRLERVGVPRALGALGTLLLGVAVLAGVLALIIPTFVDETNHFVDQVPGIVNDLEKTVGNVTGDRPSEVGSKVQRYLRRYTDNPQRLIGPITSIGVSVAGVVAALLLITITAYYIAVRPQPLVEGALRLVPPRRRVHARGVMDRLRTAWISWMRGVVLGMFISGTLLYIGLSIIGLDFALVFAVIAALLVVVPYFGAIAGAIPPVLYALTISPGKALIVLALYIGIQVVESTVIIPAMTPKTARLHPAVVLIGVLVVGKLFGVVGLFLAVPVIAAVVIITEEVWVREIEESHAGNTEEALAVPTSFQPEEEGEPAGRP